MKSTDMVKYDVRDPTQLQELLERFSMELFTKKRVFEEDFDSDSDEEIPPSFGNVVEEEEQPDDTDTTIRASLAPRMTNFASQTSLDPNILQYVYGNKKQAINSTHIQDLLEGSVRALLEMHKLHLVHQNISTATLMFHRGKDKPIYVLNDWDSGYSDKILNVPTKDVISEHIQDVKKQLEKASKKFSRSIVEMDVD